MSTKEELILENELLRKKLALAEAWMRREVAQHKKGVWEKAMIQKGRKKLDNILERESVGIITRKIEMYFWDILKVAPKFTLDHLIDAEIYWQTLQKFPTLDALPVVSSYQKILDSIFWTLIIWFCQYVTEKKIQEIPWSKRNTLEIGLSLDKDIENILKKWYTLSLGRWYHFFEKVRRGSAFWWVYEDLFLQYLSTTQEPFLETCITDPFYSGFREVIELEVFGKKRHESKISYSDAKKVREILLSSHKNNSLVILLLENISPSYSKKN
jgi:hypothetical protein